MKAAAATGAGRRGESAAPADPGLGLDPAPVAVAAPAQGPAVDQAPGNPDQDRDPGAPVVRSRDLVRRPPADLVRDPSHQRAPGDPSRDRGQLAGPRHAPVRDRRPSHGRDRRPDHVRDPDQGRDRQPARQCRSRIKLKEQNVQYCNKKCIAVSLKNSVRYIQCRRAVKKPEKEGVAQFLDSN